MELLPYPLLAAVLIILLGATAVLFLKRGSPSREGNDGRKKLRARDRSSLLREADKRLALNPRDPEALLSLAELYFLEEDYDKALKHYRTLSELCATHAELNELDIAMRHGLAAMKLKNYPEAYKNFLIGRTLDEDNFVANYNLGFMEFSAKNYPKAVPFLQKAAAANPDHTAANKLLGLGLLKLKKPQEAVQPLRRVIDFEPEDKESLFALAQVYLELGHGEMALKIFSHLRLDPTWGASAALYSGTIHFKAKDHQQAISDFQIGLRHENLPRELLLELKYRQAAAHLFLGEIPQTIRLWNEIQELQPEYKDIKQQLAKYQEIYTNSNLQVYLLASSSEFVNLCRRIASKYFTNATVKMTNIAMHKNEYVDILAEVNTRQWEDIVILRFVRSAGQIGELILRELYSRIKDTKAGRGVCVSAGSFTETAQQFVEARLIDLVDKEGLLKLFKRLIAC